MVGRYRWVICGMLFAATAINYIDRQIIGVLKPTLQLEYGWTETAFASVVFWFQAAYAVGYLGFGKLIDRFGARLGYAAAVVIWTVAHIAHAVVSSIGGFVVARLVLGLGESGNFPAGLKAIAEWFPKRERALATGILTAGSNVGAVLTPLIVPAVTLAFGWRASFVVTGSFSLVWLVIWLKIYRRPEDHPRVGAAELAHINSDAVEGATTGTSSTTSSSEPIPWRKLLTLRETWAFALGRFLIDPIWWMFLFWLPDFFAKRYHLNLVDFGPPLAVVYVVSDVGSIAGGWLSSRLIRYGASVNVARKLTMFLAALLVIPVMFAMYADSVWLAVAIVGLATAGHQAFSANLYTFPSDVFPKQAVGSVVGIGGTAGAVGGMLMSKYAGWVLDSIGSYTPIFVVAGTVYLLALAVIHALSPRMRAVRLVPDRPMPAAASADPSRL
ncbi:MAG: transporter [Gammaproteobacteria bacterium]|nr:transporter [Gammaproteobacteria bacterium]